MLLALAKRLRSELKEGAATALPVGTLTFAELYQTPRYGEVDGIGPVRIDGEGNMVGFSPVTKVVDLTHGGETAWIPTDLIHNSRLDPFVITGTRAARVRPARSETTK